MQTWSNNEPQAREFFFIEFDSYMSIRQLFGYTILITCKYLKHEFA